MITFFDCGIDYLMGITNIKNPKKVLESKLSELKLSKRELSRCISDYKNTYILNNYKYHNVKNDKNFENVRKIISNVIKDYISVIGNKKGLNTSYENILKYSTEEAEKYLKIDNIANQNIARILDDLDLDKISIDSTIDKNYEKTEIPKDTTVVLVYGTIPAGVPLECIEDIIGTETIPADWLKGGKEFFALKIKGNSMFPEYKEGDIIILEKVPDCESGDDCVVMINGNDGTFKRVFKNENGIILQPLNNSYQPLIYTNQQIEELPVKILGKVVQLRRNK